MNVATVHECLFQRRIHTYSQYTNSPSAGQRAINNTEFARRIKAKEMSRPCVKTDVNPPSLFKSTKKIRKLFLSFCSRLKSTRWRDTSRTSGLYVLFRMCFCVEIASPSKPCHSSTYFRDSRDNKIQMSAVFPALQHYGVRKIKLP